jgi:NAD(P)-dependent dehydrogenase (short-subunit alcohol dehydrogenase family)
VVAKVALVTGAASGIGLATARLLSERGYAVVAADLQFDQLRSALADLPAVSAVRCDVRLAEDAHAAVLACEEGHGRLDALAHVAGVEVDRPLDELSEEQWDRVIDTNLKGTYFVCAAAIPALRRAGGGAVVTVGSVLGRVALPAVGAYAASKGGVEAMTRAMALDLAGDGIRVNTVLPGPTDTPLMWASTPQEKVAEVTEIVCREVPLARIADPREIATVIAFLLSDDASFMTGTAVAVDGGMLARSSVSA